jgi:biopolymer transport protein ExbD
VLWNGSAVDRGTMQAYMRDAALKDRLAKYDAVARVLADAQRLGATSIGFTGIDQYN